MFYKVTLNGKIYEVEVEKGEAVIQAEYEASLPQASPVVAPVAAPATPVAAPTAPVASGDAANAVKAPMPGTINAVKVSVGQAVKKGDVLVVLEAMKMENDISSPKDGKVGQIFVQKGASVETGSALVEII